MKKLFILLSLVVTFLIGQDFSLYFDGDDYIDISDQYRFEGDISSFSISFWIKPTSFDGWGSIFLFRKHFADHYLNVQSDGFIRFGLATDSGYEAIYSELIYNEWQHIVATYDGDEIKLYHNQELVSSTQRTGSSNWNDECWFTIGGNMDLSTDSCSGDYGGMIGNLDNLSLWDKTLSIEEINNIAFQINGDENGLIHNYSFNELPNESYGPVLSPDVPEFENDEDENDEDNYTINLNLEAEIYEDSCNKYYVTPDTDIGVEQNKIQAMQISWETIGMTCGGFCGSMELNLELSDADGNVFWSSYNECYPSDDSGSVVIYPEITSSSTLTPNLYMHVIDVASASAKIDWITINIIDGCTDELACNYDQEANTDDGSCDYLCYDIDNSLSFDGTNAHVEIPHDNHLNLENEGFTIFTRVMFKSFEDQRRHQILTKSENAGMNKKWIFGLPNIHSGGQGPGGSDNSFVFHAHDGYGGFYARSNEFTPELDTMYDIAVSSENGNYTFYIDGYYWGLDSGDGGFADIVSNTADLLIGAKEPNESWDIHSLDGNIDELVIWDTFLTAEQIFDISHNENDINSYDIESDNIVANWQFNQNNSGINNEYLIDESGNQNHGTINGAEWSCNISQGDLNNDCVLDIVDIVAMINYIINLEYNEQGDMNGDGELNILDVLTLLYSILNS